MTKSNVAIEEMANVSETILSMMMDFREEGQKAWHGEGNVMVRSEGNIYIFPPDTKVSDVCSKGYTVSIQFESGLKDKKTISRHVKLYIWDGVNLDEEMEYAKDYLRRLCMDSLGWDDIEEVEFVKTVPNSSYSHWFDNEKPVTVERDGENFPIKLHKGWLINLDDTTVTSTVLH